MVRLVGEGVEWGTMQGCKTCKWMMIMLIV